MSFEINCPNCKTALLADVGRSECYSCGQVFEVAEPAPATAKNEAAERVVRFLRGLLYDGELSGDEVWSLANWLNKQLREVCQQWPANVLIPLLQNVFEDGELSSEEMVAVAKALVAIEREWASRFAPVEDASEPQRSAVAGSQAWRRPELPPVNYSSSVESSSGDGEYRVDLANHTCTCADWVSWRKAAAPGDYKRMCKHMARLYDALEVGEETGDPMFSAFVDDHWERERGTAPHDDWIFEVVNGKPVLYGHAPEKPWVNVFVPQGSAYQRFGYNKEERRWSYGESPKGYAKFFRQKFQDK